MNYIMCRLLLYRPHLAHVSEILFYFYSTVLWQPSVYNTDPDIPCIYTLSIGEDNVIWNSTEEGAHSQYVKHLLLTMQNEWKINQLVQPKKCLKLLELPANSSKTNNPLLEPSSDLFSEESSWPLVRQPKITSPYIILQHFFRVTFIPLCGCCIQQTRCNWAAPC